MQTEPARHATEVVVDATGVLMGIAARSVPPSADVTLHQFRALALLDAHGTLRVNALAEQVGVSPSTATRLCDRLVAKRLIRRRTAPGNRREVVIALTPAGSALVGRAMTRRREAIAAIMAKMSPEHRRHLLDALEAFVAASGEEAGLDWAFGASGEAE